MELSLNSRVLPSSTQLLLHVSSWLSCQLTDQGLCWYFMSFNAYCTWLFSEVAFFLGPKSCFTFNFFHYTLWNILAHILRICRYLFISSTHSIAFFWLVGLTLFFSFNLALTILFSFFPTYYFLTKYIILSCLLFCILMVIND